MKKPSWVEVFILADAALSLYGGFFMLIQLFLLPFYCTSLTPFKRTCGQKRRKEAVEKTTDVLESMIKRIFSSGISADYILMDSWFGMPKTILRLRPWAHVIVSVFSFL